ncbi:TIGR04255 family protein [Ectothiorhodospira mobilis]|uniref:TIGR04255 family protein n=1 Tax=Ectothiorhodospira mobilis TaxID=195064 RepID=UPI0019072F88|nr:TIGR04255 family protein [Ectothiorhodospira mobilis]MBK1693020.1 hypothetical protein [Ectothiorhodospira mobilis]
MSHDAYLTQAPLIHVAARIAFSRLPDFDEQAMETFHRRLVEEGFPERIEASLSEVTWSLPGPSGQEPKRRVRQRDRNVFKGPGHRRLVELRSDQLLFKVTDYEGHERFLSDWFRVIHLAAEVLPGLNKALLRTCNLRYVDLIVPKEDEKLQDLVSSALLPPPLSQVQGSPLFGATTKILNTGEQCRLRLQFEELQPRQGRLTRILPDDLVETDPRAGLSIQAQPHWEQAMQCAYGLLDIEHVHEAPDKPPLGDVDMEERFRKLHDSTRQAFWGIITAKARQSWA